MYLCFNDMHDAHLEKNIFESGDHINWKWGKKSGQEQHAYLPIILTNCIAYLLT